MQQATAQNNSSTYATNKSISSKSSNTVQIDITYGDDGGQQTMAQLDVAVQSFISTNIKQKNQQLLNQIQSTQTVNNDILLVFKFQVESGRQRQSLQFIEKGLDQYKDNQNISVVQKLFKRPKTTGSIELKQVKGYVYVIYRFYEEMSGDILEGFKQIEETSLDIDFKLKAVLKGTAEASKRSFTSIKSDYLHVNLNSQKLYLKGFLQYLQRSESVPPQIQQTQIYKLLNNLQIARMKLKFDSIRKMYHYYNRIFTFSTEQKEQEQEDINYNKTKERPLSNKGIFKDSLVVSLIIADRLSAKAQLKYKNEQIMFRMVARITQLVIKIDKS